MPLNPTLGCALGSWMDDGILVEIFGMLNVKGLELKGTDCVSIPELPREKFGLNPVIYK